MVTTPILPLSNMSTQELDAYGVLLIRARTEFGQREDTQNAYTAWLQELTKRGIEKRKALEKAA